MPQNMHFFQLSIPEFTGPKWDHHDAATKFNKNLAIAETDRASAAHKYVEGYITF